MILLFFLQFGQPESSSQETVIEVEEDEEEEKREDEEETLKLKNPLYLFKYLSVYKQRKTLICLVMCLCASEQRPGLVATGSASFGEA